MHAFPRPPIDLQPAVAPGAAQGGDLPLPGFNLVHGPDRELVRTTLRGEFPISGFQARQLRPHLADDSGAQLSRLLHRLRTPGLIQKIGQTLLCENNITRAARVPLQPFRWRRRHKHGGDARQASQSWHVGATVWGAEFEHRKRGQKSAG